MNIKFKEQKLERYLVKTYKTSITSFFHLSYWIIIILQISLNLNYGRFLYLNISAIIIILTIIFFIVIKTKYKLNDTYLIIKTGFDSTKIANTKIESIRKKKFLFLNKYYLELKSGRFNFNYLYPRQDDINNIINDILEINPNVIIKEYKSYNENL